MSSKEDIAACQDLNEDTEFPLIPNLLENNRNSNQSLTINRVTSLFMSSTLVFDNDEKMVLNGTKETLNGGCL
jgi:hypothetical protein